MKTLTTILLITFLVFTSCDITGNQCGPFQDKYRVTDFTNSLKKISYKNEDSTNFELEEISSDTVNFDNYAIQIDPVEEFYSMNMNKGISFGLVTNAYACSPPIPSTEDRLLNIEIFSSEDYNSNYPANINLTDLFNILTIKQGEAPKKEKLSEYIEAPNQIPNNILLTLREEPEDVTDFKFTVVLRFKTEEDQSYSFNTNSIYIKP